MVLSQRRVPRGDTLHLSGAGRDEGILSKDEYDAKAEELKKQFL